MQATRARAGLKVARRSRSKGELMNTASTHSREHEQARAGLGDHREAETDVGVLVPRKRETIIVRPKKRRVANETSTPAAASIAGRAEDHLLIPLVHVAALIVGAVRARRARIAA